MSAVRRLRVLLDNGIVRILLAMVSPNTAFAISIVKGRINSSAIMRGFLAFATLSATSMASIRLSDQTGPLE